MKILLVVNPSASSVTARTRVVIQKALSADHEMEFAETSRRGHASRLAQSAAANGTDVVVVLGGDGTLNEAANGLAGSNTALAPLPGGSTNVFARTLGLSDDPVEATGQLLEALQRGSIQRVGLGSANGRFFLFHCGVGYDAAVVEQVERRGTWKRYAGHPLFIWAAVDTWFRHYDRKTPPFRVLDANNETEGVDGFFTIVMNTNPYTYLGTRPLDIAPEATLDRPLTAITIKSLSVPGISRLVAGALRSGNKAIQRAKIVDYRADVESLRISGHRPFPYQVDGDYLGDVKSLTFRHEAAVLDLVIPLPEA